MTQQNLLELAKQGDANAIATLINRSLQPQGITAKASIKNGCLQIMLESQQVPDQQTLVPQPSFLNSWFGAVAEAAGVVAGAGGEAGAGFE